MPQTFPYVRKASSLYCPSDSHPAKITHEFVPPTVSVSYGINGYLTRFTSTKRLPSVFKDDISDLSKMVLIGDSIFVTASHPAHYLCNARQMPKSEKSSTDFLKASNLKALVDDPKQTRHDGRVNVAFADGSAKSFDQKELGLLPGSSNPQWLGSYGLIMNPADPRMKQ